jgi:cytochrome P450
MVACAERTTASWSPGAARDVHKEMGRLTLDIVARTLFGTRLGDEFREVGEALETIVRRFAGRGGVLFQVLEGVPTPENLRFRRALRSLDGIIARMIGERRREVEAGRDAGDLLSMLLLVRDEETGEGMSDRQLRDEVLTLFLAGHETTANALSWTWHLLGLHPEAEAWLHEELDGVLEGGRAPTVEDLPRLERAGRSSRSRCGCTRRRGPSGGRPLGTARSAPTASPRAPSWS